MDALFADTIEGHDVRHMLGFVLQLIVLMPNLAPNVGVDKLNANRVKASFRVGRQSDYRAFEHNPFVGFHHCNGAIWGVISNVARVFSHHAHSYSWAANDATAGTPCDSSHN